MFMGSERAREPTIEEVDEPSVGEPAGADAPLPPSESFSRRPRVLSSEELVRERDAMAATASRLGPPVPSYEMQDMHVVSVPWNKLQELHGEVQREELVRIEEKLADVEAHKVAETTRWLQRLCERIGCLRPFADLDLKLWAENNRFLAYLLLCSSLLTVCLLPAQPWRCCAQHGHAQTEPVAWPRGLAPQRLPWSWRGLGWQVSGFVVCFLFTLVVDGFILPGGDNATFLRLAFGLMIALPLLAALECSKAISRCTPYRSRLGECFIHVTYVIVLAVAAQQSFDPEDRFAFRTRVLDMVHDEYMLEGKYPVGHLSHTPARTNAHSHAHARS